MQPSSQMLKGILEGAILRIIQQGDIYGYGLHENWAHWALAISRKAPSTRYCLNYKKTSSSLAFAVLPAMAPIANIITSLMPVKTLWLTFSNSGNNLPKQWHSLTKEVPNHEKLNRLRTANDQLLKNIHGTDYTYTETVIQYLRGALFKDPYAIEHAISDLLATLIEAQQAGHRVASFFSDDPQTAADNILAELPRVSWWYLFDQYWPILMFLFSSSIFTMLVSQDNQLSLSNTIAPLTVVFAFLGLPFARGVSFNKLSAKTIFGLLLVVTLLVIVPLILSYLTVSHSEFAFSHTTLTIICGSCAVLNLAVALGFRQIAKLFLGWSTIWLLALAGLLLPISAFTVGIAIAGVVLAALLLFYHPEPHSGLIA